jgi:hypothetical protein
LPDALIWDALPLEKLILMASIPSFEITENGIVVAFICRKKEMPLVYPPETTQFNR